MSFPTSTHDRLVELIVLNVGLQAGILSQRVFSMFVVMALITTFLTTPIVTFLYSLLLSS
jgi:Kef-type K+ transport system membrane component KefB